MYQDRCQYFKMGFSSAQFVKIGLGMRRINEPCLKIGLIMGIVRLFPEIF